MESKSIVVMVVDHDAYKADHPDSKEFKVEDLVYLGRAVNEAESGWNGYEAWMIIHDIPEDVFNKLNELNIPADPE